MSSVVANVGQLTQLKSLQLLGPHADDMMSLSHGDLQPLTQLTQLSFLGIEDSIMEQCEQALWDSFTVGVQRFGASGGCNRTLVSKVSSKAEIVYVIFT